MEVAASRLLPTRKTSGGHFAASNEYISCHYLYNAGL